jgi:hypothetical protein
MAWNQGRKRSRMTRSPRPASRQNRRYGTKRGEDVLVNLARPHKKTRVGYSCGQPEPLRFTKYEPVKVQRGAIRLDLIDSAPCQRCQPNSIKHFLKDVAQKLNTAQKTVSDPPCSEAIQFQSVAMISNERTHKRKLPRKRKSLKLLGFSSALSEI